MPELHPAQALPAGATAFSAGMGAHWVNGQAQREVSDAAQAATGAPNAEPADGAKVAAAQWSPGLFPWVNARLGLGSGNEAGLSYTGERIRLNARHAMSRGGTTMSLGLALMTRVPRQSTSDTGRSTLGFSEPISGLDTSQFHAVGADLPLLFGWRSSADVVRAWVGIRPSYERGYGSISTLSQVTSSTADVHSNYYSVTGLFGFAFGLRPLFLAMELDVGTGKSDATLRNSASGNSTSLSVSGYTITPATAIIWEIR